MARIDEIGPDLYRICIYVPAIDLQFNHFLVKDDEPSLFHTGMRRMFPDVRDAVAKIIDPAALRWISWSHFEVDECGALNEWLAVAPQATPVCSECGAMVNLADFSNRPPRGLKPGETLETGRRRFTYVPTPHLPHGWDAGVLFEERDRILLCSDLLHQIGDLEPMTTADVVGRYRHAIATYQAAGNHLVTELEAVLHEGDVFKSFDHARGREAWQAFLDKLDAVDRDLAVEQLAALQPRTLAAMHGSTFIGDGAAALRASAEVLRDVLGTAGSTVPA